jgi:hypothetical protein
MQIAIEYDENFNVLKVAGFPMHRTGALGLLATAASLVNKKLDEEEAKVVKAATPGQIPPLHRLNGSGA